MNSKFFRPYRRLLTWAVTGMLLSSCQPGSAPTGNDASPTPNEQVATTATPLSSLIAGEILAGQGIKDVGLDQNKTEVEKVLGAPEEVDSNEYAPGQTYALYYSKGIELSYSQDKLNVITLHGNNDKWKAYTGGTKEGLGVGSSAQQISEVLGEPDLGETSPRAMRYRKQGLWFRLDADRGSDSAKAESLQVMKPE